MGFIYINSNSPSSRSMHRLMEIIWLVSACKLLNTIHGNIDIRWFIISILHLSVYKLICLYITSERGIIYFVFSCGYIYPVNIWLEVLRGFSMWRNYCRRVAVLNYPLALQQLQQLITVRLTCFLTVFLDMVLLPWFVYCWELFF